MAKKDYTILIASQKTAKVKKFMLSPLTLIIVAGTLGTLLVVSGFMAHKYMTFRIKVAELQTLRTETRAQQAEIRSFLEKISLLEEQLDKLKVMEEQVEQDLKEVIELRKNKKATPKVSRKNTLKDKTSPLIITQKQVGKVPFSPEENIFILDKERKRLVSRLHYDLFDLRQEFSQREISLGELQECLQTQKSILLSTPSIWPVSGWISSRFGDRRLSPSSGGTRPHKGVDISARSGTTVVAPADGVVRFAGRESEYGRLIRLEHSHGFSTMFGHLKAFLVKSGDKVRKGQAIGRVGMSGNSTGPHLHYEVRIHGRPVNPTLYLNESK